MHCAYFTALDRIAPLMAQTRALLGPGKALVAGLQLLHPTIRDRADLTARVGQARGLVEGLCFYNLGLVPPARLEASCRLISSNQVLNSGEVSKIMSRRVRV